MPKHFISYRQAQVKEEKQYIWPLVVAFVLLAVGQWLQIVQQANAIK